MTKAILFFALTFGFLNFANVANAGGNFAPPVAFDHVVVHSNSYKKILADDPCFSGQPFFDIGSAGTAFHANLALIQKNPLNTLIDGSIGPIVKGKNLLELAQDYSILNADGDGIGVIHIVVHGTGELTFGQNDQCTSLVVHSVSDFKIDYLSP